MLQRTILVCDKDIQFIDEIEKNLSPDMNIKTARTQVEAQHLICDRQIRVSHICLNINLCDPASVPLIRFCRSNRPAAPISILSDSSKDPFSLDEMDSLHIQKIIHKPISLNDLVKEIIPSNFFDLEKALNEAQGDQELVGAVADKGNEEMHPIDAENFLGGAKSFFDVYVKIGKDKFLKILKAKDVFDSDRVLSYLKKGVTTFYIKKEAQTAYLHYCDKIAAMLLQRTDISSEVKKKHVINLGKETQDHLKMMGLSEMSIGAAARFVGHTGNLVKQLDLSKSGEVASLIGDLQNAEHTVGIAMILGLILEAKEFKDENVISVISLSGFLHDIGLFKLPEHLQKITPWKVSEAEREIYEKHPVSGAELVQNIPGLNPLIPQVIRQHHERRNRKGYPSQLGSGSISPVSEIVGIADVFHDLIELSKTDTSINPLEMIESKFFNEFSFQTIDAFRAAFMLKKH